jgi:hypothetical protein
VVVVAGTAPVLAQSADWERVENPYQEDVAYLIGDTFEPGVEVDGVRWHSFTVAAPDPARFRGGGNISTEVNVSFENRRAKSAKVLVVLLLEDGDGNPLERVEIRQFKVPASRMKERTEDVALPVSVYRETERAYLFFEIME